MLKLSLTIATVLSLQATAFAANPAPLTCSPATNSHKVVFQGGPNGAPSLQVEIDDQSSVYLIKNVAGQPSERVKMKRTTGGKLAYQAGQVSVLIQNKGTGTTPNTVVTQDVSLKILAGGLEYDSTCK